MSNDAQNDMGRNTYLCRKNRQTEIVASRESTFENKRFHSNSSKSTKEKLKSVEMAVIPNEKQSSHNIFKKSATSKSYKNLQPKQ